MNLRKLLYLLAFVLLLLPSCLSDSEEAIAPEGNTCDNAAPDSLFLASIQPILLNNCLISGCHKGTPQGRPQLEQYCVVVAEIKSGRLISAITHDGQASRMPQGAPKIPQSEIDAIVTWAETVR
jgi:hypothetical protein